MPDTTQPADPVADFLADVKMQAEDHHLVLGADALRLVAALEAVLAVHRPDGVHGERRPDGQWDEHARCWESTCPDEWPCPTYEAISAALLGPETAPAGEEASHG